MKHLSKLLLILLCLVSAPGYAQNRVNGGELAFQELSDSTYRFTLKLYWNCESGIPEPVTMPLCFYNTCTSTYLSATMNKDAGGVEVPVPCASYPSTCTYPSSTMPGTKLLSYSINITLPARCGNWRLYSYYDHRNVAMNLVTSSSAPPSYFYIEATMNNTVYNNNTSAVSAAPVMSHVRQNLPYTYTLDLSDANGDSLAVENTVPLFPVIISGCNLSTGPIPYPVKTPALGVATNPFQTNNTFNLNTAFKALTFTPTEAGPQLLNLKIKEYRAGTMISSYTKEIRFMVLAAGSFNSSISGNYVGVINSSRTVDTVTVCAGQSFTVIRDFKSTSPTSILSVSDNHLYGANTSAVSYSAQNKDSIRATFHWTAPSTPGASHLVVFTVKDSTCQSVITTNNVTYPLYINIVGKPVALKDTTICAGNNTQLLATRGGNYTWSVLPGGSAGSLSCTTCANPIATPSTTTSYEVTSAASVLCGNNKDTVTITVEPVKVPTISLAPATVYYKPGTPVTLTATITSCATPTYQWKKNGTVITGATSATYTYTPTGLDNITCQMTCGDICTSPKIVSASKTLQWNVGIANTTANLQAIITPNPNNGSFEISGLAMKAGKVQYSITNLAGQSIVNGQYTVAAGNYKQTLKTNLPAGVYILKLQDDDNSSVVQKLIIQ